MIGHTLPNGFEDAYARDLTPPLPGAPVFIGGDGRSGTTLISVLLDSHERLAVGPELHFKGPPNLGPYVLEGLELLRSKDPRMAEEALREDPTWRPAKRFVARARRFGVDDDALRSLCTLAMDRTGTELASFEERCALVHLMGSWIAATAGKPRWGMKIMKEIKRPDGYAAAWPQARFVHIVRDPRDVAASQLRDHASWGYSDVATAAERWQALVLAVASATRRLPITEVRYEDVVQQPAAAVRRVLDALGEPWSDAVLRHSEQAHAVTGPASTHPSKDALLQPLTSAAIGRYRRDLSADEVATIETLASDGLRLHGYAAGA